MTSSTELPHGAFDRSPAECVDRGAVAAICAGQHGDPFSILGPHEVAPGIWDIRAFIPWGDKIEAIGFHDDAVLATFETVDPAGFRVARVKSEGRPGYRIRITADNFGHVVYDPYTLGSALADYDIAAIVHSNDTVFYYIFGAHPITHAKLPGVRFVVWAPKM
jgi:1,4-alpha-glucan branching enzyme